MPNREGSQALTEARSESIRVVVQFGHLHRDFLTAMIQRSDNSLASSIHASIDWMIARWNERESWDGVTVIILSLLVWMLSSFVVYIAWAGLAYGGWLVWKRGGGHPLLKRD